MPAHSIRARSCRTHLPPTAQRHSSSPNIYRAAHACTHARPALACVPFAARPWPVAHGDHRLSEATRIDGHVGAGHRIGASRVVPGAQCPFACCKYDRRGPQPIAPHAQLDAVAVAVHQDLHAISPHRFRDRCKRRSLPWLCASCAPVCGHGYVQLRMCVGSRPFAALVCRARCDPWCTYAPSVCICAYATVPRRRRSTVLPGPRSFPATKVDLGNLPPSTARLTP